MDTHTHAHTEVFYEVLEKVHWTDKTVVPAVWISWSTACLYYTSHVLQPRAWKLGSQGIKFFLPCSCVIAFISVCAMLYVESFQALTVMLKEMCGEGMCVCWLGGWTHDHQAI